MNSVCSRNTLPKIKGGPCVINLDEFKSIGTHWTALYVNGNNIIYFDSFGVELIPKEIEKFIGNKNIITNIYRIQAYDSIMCRYFYIRFIHFTLKSKTQWTHLHHRLDIEIPRGKFVEISSILKGESTWKL